MKVARAERQDLDAAMMLLGLLDNIDSGYYPSDSDDNEDDPTFFDEDDPEHLAQLWRRLKACLDAAPGFQGRVIFGAATLMDPRNEVVDPEDDAIALHPRLTTALDDAARYRWLRANALDCQETDGLEIVRLIPAHRSPNHADIDAAIDAARTVGMPANAKSEPPSAALSCEVGSTDGL